MKVIFMSENILSVDYTNLGFIKTAKVIINIKNIK